MNSRMLKYSNLISNGDDTTTKSRDSQVKHHTHSIFLHF